jgi:hypothetical protein
MREMVSCQQACKGEGKFSSIRKMREEIERGCSKEKAKSSRNQLITNESENKEETRRTRCTHGGGA